MLTKTIIWPASVVVSARTAPSTRCGVPFLNIGFAPTQAALSDARLTGCGLYALIFKGRVAYVGKFLGEEADAWGSNVVAERWKRHCGTVTMRGSRAASEVGPLLDAAAESPGCNMFRGLLQCERYVGETDFQASKNRLRFASRHWETDFKQGKKPSVLDDMHFMYVRLDRHKSLGSNACIREAVSEAEKLAVSILKPVINDPMPWAEHQHWPTPIEAARVLRRSLKAFHFMARCEQLTLPSRKEFDAFRREQRAIARGIAIPRTPPPAPVRVRREAQQREPAVRHVAPGKEVVSAAVRAAMADRLHRYVVKDARENVITIGAAGTRAHVQINVKARSLTYQTKAEGVTAQLGSLPRRPLDLAELPALVREWCP